MLIKNTLLFVQSRAAFFQITEKKVLWSIQLAIFLSKQKGIKERTT